MVQEYNHEFTDLVSGKRCALFLVEGQYPVVRHPDCDKWADVTIELDAFYCVKCRMNGRVPGYWVAELVAIARDGLG